MENSIQTKKIWKALKTPVKFQMVKMLTKWIGETLMKVTEYQGVC